MENEEKLWIKCKKKSNKKNKTNKQTLLYINTTHTI